MTWLRWLMDASPFTPRSSCGAWTEPLIDSYVVASLLIWVAYWSISIGILASYRVLRSKSGLSREIVGLALFIGACGTNHLNDALAFTWPAYRHFTACLAVTAVLSVATAATIPQALRYLASLPSSEDALRILAECRETGRQKDIAIRERDQAYRLLEAERIEEINRARHYLTLLTIYRDRHDAIAGDVLSGEKLDEVIRMLSGEGNP